MNTKKCLLLSHVWITENQDYKKDIIDFSVDHFRKHNPDLYLILTGHGKRPHKDTLTKCDHVDWVDFDIKELGKGHPKTVLSGLQHAKEKGFKKVLKQRADCVIADSNVHEMYDNILKGKRFLAKHDPTGIHDLLMYGELEIFLSGWRTGLWDPNTDGVRNFTNTLDSKYMADLLITDERTLKWVYLDPYWEQINSNQLKQQILNNDFPYQNYLWGSRSSLRAQSWEGINRA